MIGQVGRVPPLVAQKFLGRRRQRLALEHHEDQTLDLAIEAAPRA
jgi:hypothetical protein